MNCFRVQSLLSAYIDQELSVDDRRLMRTHLFNCPECSHEMESIIIVKNLMGRLSSPEVPGDPLRLVRDEIYGINQNTKNYSYFNTRHLLMTAACISLFLMTSSIIFQNPSNLKAHNSSNTTEIATTRELNTTTQAKIVSTTDEVKPKPKKNEPPKRVPEIFERLQLSPTLSGTPVSR